METREDRARMGREAKAGEHIASMDVTATPSPEGLLIAAELRINGSVIPKGEHRPLIPVLLAMKTAVQASLDEIAAGLGISQSDLEDHASRFDVMDGRGNRKGEPGFEVRDA